MRLRVGLVWVAHARGAPVSPPAPTAHQRPDPQLHHRSWAPPPPPYERASSSYNCERSHNCERSWEGCVRATGVNGGLRGRPTSCCCHVYPSARRGLSPPPPSPSRSPHTRHARPMAQRAVARCRVQPPVHRRHGPMPPSAQRAVVPNARARVGSARVGRASRLRHGRARRSCA